MDNAAVLQRDLLHWFEQHKRDLPWRGLARDGARDPYRVWLAEVMLQQTQVATVIPFFVRWLDRFPTLAEFAAAPLDDVLKQWEGLGYYSRARNFHRAAQQVQADFAGEIPNTVEGLLALPGIGRYTAGAIASLAFGLDAPILDGNVKRIWARLFALTETNNEALWAISHNLLPQGRAGEFNEALMDLGATVCTPRSPSCPDCPLCWHCQAYAQGKPDQFPVKVKKPATPHKDIGTLVVLNAHGQALMGQRPTQGLLGGLWEFVSDEIGVSVRPALPLLVEGDVALNQIAMQVLHRLNLPIVLGEVSTLGTVKHSFTHFKITRHVVLSYVNGRAENITAPTPFYQQLKWVAQDEINTLALTRSDQKIVSLVVKQVWRNQENWVLSSKTKNVIPTSDSEEESLRRKPREMPR